jgi:cyclic pyranopterin phosphate synthase
MNYPKLSLSHTLDMLYHQTREDTAGKSGNWQTYTTGNVPSIKSADHFRVNPVDCPQINRFANTMIDFRQGKEPSKQLNDFEENSHNSYFMTVNNTCSKVDGLRRKQRGSFSFMPFEKPPKKPKCFEQFSYRCFTTAVNSSTNNEKPTSEMSFQNDEIGESLTHVNKEGNANMVDVGSKMNTLRYSVATARVKLGKKAFQLVKDNKMKKGDVMNVAKLAGIMAAKQTANLIPLCHNIPLTSINVDLEFEEATHSLVIEGKVKCFGKTGVEMEALTSVSVAALTVYDMCKAVSVDIVITDIQLMEKDGGKSGYFVRNPSEL